MHRPTITSRFEILRGGNNVVNGRMRSLLGPVAAKPQPAVYLTVMDYLVRRRSFLVSALGGTALLPLTARAQQSAPVSPVPAPRDWSGGAPLQYPDPDIIALDKRFGRYIIFNTTIKRLHTGTSWAEGPAWSGEGRYLVWSDIPNNVQLRLLEEDGHISVF